MKAYRKLAQQWHPDNFSDEKEKKRAEKKFIDIAAAKEVCSELERSVPWCKVASGKVSPLARFEGTLW